MDEDEQAESADHLRKLLSRLPGDLEAGTEIEYRPHVGERTQTIHFEPADPDGERDAWFAWTTFGGADVEEVTELVRDAARESSGLSFRESDGEMRAQVLLEAEAPVEVRARLVEHLGEVADRLEFNLSEGADAF